MQISAPMPSSSNSEPRKVRALYDFEAAEDNELTFLAGEIIHMLDDSDPNWWKGYNQHGEGLFPANFVTADLSVEPEQFRIDASKKSVQFSDAVQVKTISHDDDTSPEINEESIDTLLNLLHEANPEDPNDDTEQMLNLEVQVNRMGPLIDAELEKIDRKHAQLTQLSGDLVEALNLYHTLMREPERPQIHQNIYAPQGFSNMPQQQMYPPREYMSMPPNSMAMTMPPVYAMGPQMVPPGMVAAGQMNMNLPPVIGIPSGNPQLSQNNQQPHSLNSTMAQTSPMPQGSLQRVPTNNPHVNLHNMNTNPGLLPNQTIVNQNQPQMQLVQNNSQMSLVNNPQPMGQLQPGPNPMLVHQMSQHLNGLHIANGMGNSPVTGHSNPNEETQQNVQYQQRMGTNIYMQGPQALPGHM